MQVRPSVNDGNKEKTGGVGGFRVQRTGRWFVAHVVRSDLQVKNDGFVPWLENPNNTRREEWEIAGRQIKDAYEGQDFNSPLSHKRWAMGWMKVTTDQTYDMPEQWVRW
jgi:hypothetical protein